ncbi:uncharacterized protein LOC135397344 [Ornithodoros turicata]|uniref:uncharacterized protein LOC135397344 n=1 Tax=Ornithodoros turicata TaxID=34597 RepID=UPI003139A394
MSAHVRQLLRRASEHIVTLSRNPSPVMKVLHVSPHFVVVDKPPDVVINTCYPDKYPITVETMLKGSHPELVDETVEHSFRFCHRLDFSTSGVLCLALTKESGRAAYHAFNERRAPFILFAITVWSLYTVAGTSTAVTDTTDRNASGNLVGSRSRRRKGTDEYDGEPFTAEYVTATSEESIQVENVSTMATKRKTVTSSWSSQSSTHTTTGYDNNVTENSSSHTSLPGPQGLQTQLTYASSTTVFTDYEINSTTVSAGHDT